MRAILATLVLFTVFTTPILADSIDGLSINGLPSIFNGQFIDINFTNPNGGDQAGWYIVVDLDRAYDRNNDLIFRWTDVYVWTVGKTRHYLCVIDDTMAVDFALIDFNTVQVVPVAFDGTRVDVLPGAPKYTLRRRPG